MMSDSLPPQLSLLARHFAHKPSISAVEAGALYRIRSLHRRILDLEERGWKFRRERKVDPIGQRYMRYYLEKNDA